MKKLICALLSLLFALHFSACRITVINDTDAPESNVENDSQENSGSEIGGSDENTENNESGENNEDTETVPPVPLHSGLFIEGISTEQMIEYFNEVVLRVEYSSGDGDASLVQKWKEPIYYHIEGSATDKDLAVLNGLFSQLNDVAGFPGIFPADSEHFVNLIILFLEESDFNLRFSSVINGETADGAVQFWYYTETNDIYDGQIGYRTDISQEIRDSVLLEEIVNLLGISDTVLRDDSITYQYSSDALVLSEVDWVILKLLYDPRIECGMDIDACRSVLEELYY